MNALFELIANSLVLVHIRTIDLRLTFVVECMLFYCLLVKGILFSGL